MKGIWVCRIITVHNNPENMKPPAKYKHLQLPLADVETEDISQFFNSSYEFIEQARVDKTGIAPVSFPSEPWPHHRGNEKTRPDWHITHSHSSDFLTV